MRRFIISVLLLIFVGMGTFSVLQARPFEQEILVPELTFLGMGPEFTVPPEYNFIVKHRNPFRFEWEPGPTYISDGRQRVWRSLGTDGAPPAVYHATTVLGPVTPGCVVQYVAIDDDVDDRINYFLLDGEIIHEMPQGMVSEGEFIIHNAGTLSYEANDSIGMYLSVCEIQAAPTPTPPLTPTITVSPTPDDAATPTPTLPTPPAEPGPGVTSTPTATATATPPQLACARFNFEVAGDVAQTGTYVMQEVGGRVLASWYALDGWESSRWFSDLNISFPEVHVQVLYYPNDGREPVVLEIVNPAPGTPYGWLARGMCHAVEIGWP